MLTHQQQNSISSTTSPSLIPSSPSLFPTSSLSSYPSVTSLSSLHSQGGQQQQQQIPSLHSCPSLQSLQQQQYVSPQHSPQLASRPHSLSLSRKPSLVQKPSFPLLKEVKEEDVEGDAANGALPDTPLHDILKHEQMEADEDEDEDLHLVSPTTERSAADVPPSSPQAVLPSTPAMTTSALGLLTLSLTGTEGTVISGTSSCGLASTIVPTAITTNLTSTLMTTSWVPVSSRMRSQSASVVSQLQQQVPSAASTSTSSNGNQGYLNANGSAHAHAYAHHAHSFSYSGSGIPSPMVAFGGSSASSSASASLMSAAHTVNAAVPSSLGVVNQSGDDEDMHLEEWSFPPVPLPKPSCASLGLGLGPGVDANLLSTYSTSPGFRTPPGTSILSAVGTPSGSGAGGRVVSEVEGGAGTRHAVYIVDSEEVSRRLGELLENRNSTLFSSAGHTAEEDDEDEMEDWESRRRTVVAVTTDADAGQKEEGRMGAHPERIMEEVQEQQRRPQADPVLPLGDLFAPRRPAPLVHLASMPVVPQDSTSSPPASVADSRPITPPPALGHCPSYSVGTMINVTPTRKAPYPPSSQMHTPRRQWTVADAAGPDGGSPVMGVTTPPPNTPATANERAGLFGIYSSPYASSSQIYLGPQNGSAGHSREGSRSINHSRSPSKSSSSNHSRSASKAHSRSSSKAHLRSPSKALASPPLPALPSSPLLPALPPSSSLGVMPLLDAAPILTKVDLARRLGPPPKRPPPAPPLDLGLDVGMLAGLNGGAFRFPSPVPSLGAASVAFGAGDENGARRLSRRSMVERSEEEDYKYRYGNGSAYHEREESGEMDHDKEIEALRREMGFDQHLDGRHHHQQVFEDNDEEMGFRSSRRTSEYLGKGEGTLRAHQDRPALHVHSVRSWMGWGRRSRDEKKDKKDKDKSKSAPSSPVITRKSREEKRKSFGRGDGNVGGGEEASGQGKSRGRLASFFSKLAGSNSAGSSASPSTTTSSPSAYSPAGVHERKSMKNASEPDLRSTNGAWEALPSEHVPLVPPVPPLHTLPRMESRTSLKSFGSQGKSKSRRATMISQQWDDEDYGNLISGGTRVGNSVPPTPSSLASGFSLTAGTSPREFQASSIIGGISPNGLSPNLRTSWSVSNLNLLVNRGGIQELGAGTSGWMVLPLATPGMEHGFNVSEHAFATSYSPQQQLPGVGDVLRKSDDSGTSLPPPPVPPEDFVQGGMHERPPSPSLPSIPGSVASTNGLFPPGISVPNGNGNGVVMNLDKARDRMMVRLRLKSSPSLGSLRMQQQQSQGRKKLRNFAARMMGKEEYA
ncbi:hypothetical protein EST38_g10268 [Candolleomyces aberdarensis]|uniref:Uncharacterized protein n=1 Tax=Candolleomyces aberdarensis TaxID=2316362 RepID=A0A4Q2DAP2_9AGAR|nr:hypothetical protein EST38_g10268 [Candolleomyces aberdarensis]